MPKVLLVDDSPLLLKIGSAYLEKNNHQVIKASNGKEAIEKTHQEKPDIIFMDAEMPEMDGWEACSSLKSNAETQRIPIYICTGHELKGDGDQKLKDVSADGFLMKPYKPEDISKIIDTLTS